MISIALPAAVIAAVIGLIAIARDNKKKKRSTAKRLMVVLFWIYVTAVVHVTLGTLSYPPNPDAPLRIQLEPLYFLDEWATYRNHQSVSFFQNASLTFYNFIMFMPYGFFLAALFKKRFFKSLLILFFTSLLIETTQLVLSYLGIAWMRGFNVDDLIMNTAGGILVYLFVRIILIIQGKNRRSGKTGK
ncbi:VanZ family protein [Jeotgalibacillus haloalkalitolerans]|uniref:VanZ family protein n=1 Tax=Jeotgalibacillus haloalkalitolerans TaxID=3104292 RepID=A0ABU5KI70_9BACL|nr:VanZ family protein [Jeotgalibacillus sp. HH7-29]MDZ5710934.1 VanZ family protein [Jeotgalibacillus sp. HH7-29]